MLTDHRKAQERWTRGIRERKRLARAFGTFIATLAAWDWFLNPLTFRDEHSSEHATDRGEPRRLGRFAICKPDPRLLSYRPSSRYSCASAPPVPAVALDRIRRWLADVQREASGPIGWIIAEEFGRLGGRWHCHALITGVARLHRRFWWLHALRRFGYTRIEPFDPARGAAFYASKYEGRLMGELHFGGTLAGKDLSGCEQPGYEGGGHDVAVSAPVSKSYFHMSLARRHR